jgi:hypothetical protein
MTADEYINWLHKVEDIVHANPRFMSVFNIAAETAWKQCGGERWTKALKDDDVDLLRWESCFLHAQRHLFTFVTQLVPEDISRGITLQMKKDRGKYNLPVRLGFRSSATTEAIAHGGFYQDVHGLMQLLEEQYNIKDCNRLLELVKKYKRLHLKDGDHPQTIFSHYHEAMNRIKSVYPQFPDFPESWMCFDILTRLPHQYRDAVKELFRKDIATLKQEDVLSRLIAEYMHIKDSSNYEKAKMSGRSFNKPSSNGATAAAATASPPSASYSSESNNPSAVRVCYKCGKQGHFAKDCPNYSKSFGQAAIAVDDEEDYSFNEENEIGHVEQEDDESSVGYSSESTGFTAIGIEHESANYSSDGKEFNLESRDSADIASTCVVKPNQAVPDTGATLFLTGNKNLLRDVRSAPPMTIHGLGGSRVSNQVGDMLIKHSGLLLKGVRYVPGCSQTLISLGKLSESGFDFFSYNDKLYIVEKGYTKIPNEGDKRVVCVGTRTAGLYTLDLFKAGARNDATVTKLSPGDKREYIQQHALKPGGKGAPPSRKERITASQLVNVPSSTQLREDLHQSRNERKELERKQTSDSNNVTSSEVSANLNGSSSSPSSASNVRIPRIASSSASQYQKQSGGSQQNATASNREQPSHDTRSHANRQSGMGNIAFVYTAIDESSSETAETRTEDSKCSLETQFHRRFAHAGYKVLKFMSKEFELGLDPNKAICFRRDGNCTCEVCLLTRMRSMRVGKRTAHRYRKAKRIMETWHVDLVEPSSFVGEDEYRYKLPSMEGYNYEMTVVDEHGEKVMVVPLIRKSDATAALIKLINYWENHFDHQYKIKRIHTDQGGELTNKAFEQFCTERGISHTVSPAYLHQYNGVVERMNQSLNQMVRSMLEEAQAPQALWDYALSYAANIHNVLPIVSKNGTIPELLFKKDKEEITAHIKEKYKVFGCNAYPIIENKRQGKYQGNRVRGINLGWNEEKQRYYILLLTDNVNKLKVIESVDVEFDESKFNYLAAMKQIIIERSELTVSKNASSNREYEVEDIIDHRENGEIKEYLILWKGYRKPTWEPEENLTNCKDKLAEYEMKCKQEKFHSYYAYSVDQVDELVMNCRTKEGNQYKEPKGYKQALADIYRAEWIIAIKEELNSLYKQQVFKELDYIPSNRKLLRCIWVFKAKLDENNQIVRWKARLVVQGFMQIEGIDFWDTYAPTMRFKILRIVLALAAKDDLEIKQIDFDTAFLNALLKEQIYVQIPEGYELGDYQKNENIKCLQLLKALYGLKQAPREWNKEIDTFLRSLGYEASVLDECLYQKIINGKRMYLTLFVDDTLAIYPKELESVWLEDKAKIASKYKIKDIGDCEWIFNMKLERNREKRIITLSQESYISRVVEQYGYTNNVRSISTPFQYADISSFDVDTPESELEILDPVEQKLYQSKVGEILYAANITRIDLQFIIGVLARYVSCPLRRHMQAIDRVIRYAACTRDRKLVFNFSDPSSREGCSLINYTDSDWATERVDRKSTSGWLCLLNGAPVGWQSKKQTIVATSSTEAEYYGITEAIKEALFMQQFIKHYYLNDNETIIPLIKSDNEGAILMADHATDHNRTKHIDIRYHFIRDHLHKRDIDLQYVETSKNIADILTKAVRPQIYQQLIKQIF